MELKNTLNLPRTSFSMKANLPRREPEILQWWNDNDVYGQIRRERASDATYVMHDGPPYANGHIHLGHALNKILKDTVVKSHSMAGFDAPYIPGWDCHGLPIEHQLDKELGPQKAEMSTLEFRHRCRVYAEKFVAVQREEFHRLGVMWDHALDAEEEREGRPNRRAIYRTIDRDYEAEIVRQLGRFFVAGSVYHGVKPVHWCPHCRTALAEAEVEYQDRTDPSIYVLFPLRGLDARVPELTGRDAAVLIWTTTPWTLPANLAVALHPDLDYLAVDIDGRAVILAAGLLESVSTALGWVGPEVLARFRGSDLVGQGDEWVGNGVPVERPYLAPSGAAARDGVLILGDHVTLDAGTGAVHTAPGHGADDFRVGQAYGLDVFNPVGDDGRFLPDRVGQPWLAGKPVLEANQAILDDLRERGLLLHSEDYPHSYPHCWRCKTAVLFRSTPQWFISMESTQLRNTALAGARDAAWNPASGEERMAQLVETRPDWCISRQRNWGVPIPAVVCGTCIEQNPDAFLRDPRFFEHVADLFAAEGSNAWFGVPDGDHGYRPYASGEERLARLVPTGVTCPGCSERDGLEFHEHIVDVWFESGVSHAAVLGHEDRLPWPADLYLEGHDQYRGWFQSSLLVAVNDRERAPYREVLIHGFTLDGDGRKMSKALGNVISPIEVAGRRGAEVLRLWVAMLDYTEDVRLSEETLDRNAEAYRKIRNTFRYLLGNLDGFDPARDRVPYAAMEEIDRWALQQLEALRQRIVRAYEKFEHHAVYHGLHQFAAVTLSSVYLDILKDRLYTYPAAHPARRSAQTALHHLADGLCRLMAPVLCFTAEEVWQELRKLSGHEAWTGASIHAERFPDPVVEAVDSDLLDRWARLIGVREEVNRALEIARAEKRIGTGLEAHVILEADEATTTFLRSFGEGLRFLFITSEVELGPAGENAFRSEALSGLSIEVRRAAGEKCKRCWHWTTDVGGDERWPEVCGRCAGHVESIVGAMEPGG